METARLLIRPLTDADSRPFMEGIADRSLRIAYGFPPDMEDPVPEQIFRNFLRLDRAWALAARNSGEMIGFLLDVEPELPAEILSGLPEKGRTLAFAVFPAYQRKGFMQEALQAYIPALFLEPGTEYIHCGHFTENLPSRNLLQKLAFREYAKHTIKNGRIIIDDILYRT